MELRHEHPAAVAYAWIAPANKMGKSLAMILLLIYTFLVVTGFLADLVLPAYVKQGDLWIFHGSYTIGFTLANAALLFVAIILLIVLVSLGQRQRGVLTRGLLVRRGLVIATLALMLFFSVFGSAYILFKRIIVSSQTFDYSSLLEKKQVQWSDVSRMNGNFIAGTRLGLDGAQDYAWVDFTLTDGGTDHFSLRFMQANQQVRAVIPRRLTTPP